MRIDKPGKYVTEAGHFVEVEFIRNGYAVGFYSGCPAAWLCEDGKFWTYENGVSCWDRGLAIAKEYKEPIQFQVEVKLGRIDGQMPFAFIGTYHKTCKVIARKTITIIEGEGMNYRGL